MALGFGFRWYWSLTDPILRETKVQVEFHWMWPSSWNMCTWRKICASLCLKFCSPNVLICCLFYEIHGGNLRHSIFLNCLVYHLCHYSALYFYPQNMNIGQWVWHCLCRIWSPCDVLMRYVWEVTSVTRDSYRIKDKIRCLYAKKRLQHVNIQLCTVINEGTIDEMLPFYCFNVLYFF